MSQILHGPILHITIATIGLLQSSHVNYLLGFISLTFYSTILSNIFLSLLCAKHYALKLFKLIIP